MIRIKWSKQIQKVLVVVKCRGCDNIIMVKNDPNASKTVEWSTCTDCVKK